MIALVVIYIVVIFFTYGVINILISTPLARESIEREAMSDQEINDGVWLLSILWVVTLPYIFGLFIGALLTKDTE